MEAADLLDVNPQAVVVNIQGDEPLLAPRMLSELVAPFTDPGVLVTTLAQPMAEADTRNPDRVKVVCSLSGRALYFSRSALPARAADTSLTVLGHIGLYAFRLPCLREFVSWPPSPLERTERLEQLRLLEHDIPVHVVLTDHGSLSVDRPEDLEAVRRQLIQATEG
jgi:3-deoxy-manno-octulosonate cytidylyltransferase (CMP-KDO synthetase)